MAGVRHDRFKGNPNPIDPDVKIPEAVRRQAEAADRRQREAYNLPADPEAPPAEPPAEPAPVAAPSPSSAEPPPAPEPASAPAPVEPQPSSQPVPETGAHDSWENRYKAENGRLLATKRLLDDTTTQMRALQHQVDQLTARINAAPPPAAPTPTPQTVDRLVTEKDENDFGPEMLDLMRRVAREVVAPEVAPVRQLQETTQSLANRLNGTSEVVARDARQRMLATMDQQMPDWRRVNDMAEFKAWLALPDPYFGVIRHPKLLEAFDQNDTARVLQFFRGFVSELAATSPATPGLPTPPAPVQPDPQGLEALAAPGRARQSAATTPPTEKQIITTADINAFYAAKRAGRYNGREEEFNRLEQELFLAQREGRVRAS